MNSCPVCSCQLDQFEKAESLEQNHYICRNQQHDEGIGFSAAYDKNQHLRYFFMKLDNYTIESCYVKNRTTISVKKNNKVEPLLYLPLVHFELCSLEEIKKKLKLLVMMY